MMQVRRLFHNCIFLILMLPVFLFSNFKLTEEPEKFSGETIVFKWEVTQGATTQFLLEDSVSIFRVPRHTIYRVASFKTIDSTEQQDGKLVTVGKTATDIFDKFTYYVQNTGSEYCFKYDSLSAKRYSMRVLVDSLLKNKAFKGAQFCNLDNFKRVSSVTKGETISEVYLPVAPSENRADSIYLSYSKKLNDLLYTFSGKLDSIQHAKLFYIRFVQNPARSDQGAGEAPKGDYMFRLKKTELSISDRKMLTNLIKVNRKFPEARDKW